MDTNPYQPSTVVSECDETAGRCSNAALWRAYLLAPAVAPLTFVTIFLCLAIFGVNYGIAASGFLIVPIMAMTVGVLFSYVVAGAIGMPIVFFLRNRNLLNGYTIHGVALAWSIVFSLALSSLLEEPQWNHLKLTVYLVCGFTPPILASATAFWLLIRRDDHRNSTLHGAEQDG